MNTQYLKLTSEANSIITDVNCRSKILSLAVAVALSSLSSLPSSPVESPAQYFIEQLLPVVRSALSTINENIVFDVRWTQDFVRQLWLLRYQVAHPSCFPVYSLDYGFFDAVVGIPNIISKEDYLFANTHKQAILFLSFIVVGIVEEMRQQNVA